MMQSLTRETRREALRCTVLFAGVPTFELDQIAAYSAERRFTPGERLVRRDEPGTSMMILIQGRLRVGATSAEGRELTLSLLGPGSVLGEMSVLDGKPRSADVVAISSGLVLVLERGVVLPFLRSRPELLLRLLQILCDRLRQADAALESLALASLAVRLARTLLILAAEHGTLEPGGTLIRLQMSQGDLATLVGATREGVNRQLRRWREEGVTGERDGHLVLVKLDALRALSTGERAASPATAPA
jgi:CRP/FNR family transcriptional regulator, cyclic AMP receptor protein